MSSDQVNFISYSLESGGAPQDFPVGDGAAVVTVTAIQGFVGVAQYGSGTWTPTAVASMTGNNNYIGAVLAEGQSISFTTRSAQTPDQVLYLASLASSGSSIASVSVIPV